MTAAMVLGFCLGAIIGGMAAGLALASLMAAAIRRVETDLRAAAAERRRAVELRIQAEDDAASWHVLREDAAGWAAAQAAGAARPAKIAERSS